MTKSTLALFDTPQLFVSGRNEELNCGFRPEKETWGRFAAPKFDCHGETHSSTVDFGPKRTVEECRTVPKLILSSKSTVNASRTGFEDVL